MNEQDQAAFEAKFPFFPGVTQYHWALKGFQAALAHRDAQAAQVNQQMLKALHGLLNIVSDSQGVAGYHLNGEIAKWDEFEEVDAAEAAIAAAEAQSSEPSAGKKLVRLSLNDIAEIAANSGYLTQNYNFVGLANAIMDAMEAKNK